MAFVQTHLHRLGYAPLIPDLTAELGLTYAAAGAIQTAYFWTYTIVQLPIGLVVDRWGVRRVMLACMGLLALGAVAFALSRGYVTAIAARMLVGIGAAAVWVPGLRLISEWFPPADRGRATGMMGAGAGIGGTIGLMVIPWIAAGWGWRWAYALTALPAVVTFALIAALLPASRDGTVPPRPQPGGLRQVLASRPLWPFNITVTLAYGAYFSFLTFLPAFLVRGMGMPTPQAGVVTGLITAGTIVSWPLAGVVSDWLGRRKPVYLVSQLAGMATCVAFALVVPGLGTAGATATAVLAGLLTGGVIIPFVMVTELFPPRLAGTAAGVANTAAFVGGMVLPIVLGRVVDVTGSFAAAFLLAAGVQALALASGLLVVETGSRGARVAAE